MPVLIGVTVTIELAVNAPLTVVAVIVAEPTATPVTTPAALTVATAGVLDIHVTFLLLALAGRTVAVRGVVAPTATLAGAGFTVRLVGTMTMLLTVITELAVNAPITVVAVTVAEPTETPVTTPDEFTVATAGALDAQVTFLFVARTGRTVAVRVVVTPRPIVAVGGVTDTLVGLVTLVFTVTMDEAAKGPSAVVAVTVAVPIARPVTTPDEFTAAMAGALEVHVMVLFEAFAGEIVAVIVVVPPTIIDVLGGATVTPVTRTGGPLVGSVPKTSTPSAYSGIPVTVLSVLSTPRFDGSLAAFQAAAGGLLPSGKPTRTCDSLRDSP